MSDEAQTVTLRVGNDGARIVALGRDALSSWLRGKGIEESLRAVEDGFRNCEEAGLPWKTHFQATGVFFEIFRGDLDAAQRRARLAMQEEVVGTAFTGPEWQAQIVAHAFAGDHQKVVRMWEEQRENLLAIGDEITVGASCQIHAAVEALAMVGEYDAVSALHDLATKVLRNGALISYMGSSLSHNYAAIAAAAAGDWQSADAHLATALWHSREIPFRSAEGDALRWHGKLLLDLGDAGEADRAHKMLGQALEIYRELKMPLHIELVEGMPGAE